MAMHAGFGVFSDIIPMQIADLAAINAPNDPMFVGMHVPIPIAASTVKTPLIPPAV